MADVSARIDILSAISSTIKDSSQGAIRERVISHYVEKEITKRTDALIAAFEKLASLQKDLAKIKPTPSGYDVDGKPVGELYSKEQIDSKNKTEAQVRKIEEAIELAMRAENPDFSKLYNLN